MHQRTQGSGGNPLRRDADRTRARLHAVFMLACLLAVICGVAVGRSAWTNAGRASADIARHRHSVTAVTVGKTMYRSSVRQVLPPVEMEGDEGDRLAEA
ncbi:hypothetical protein ACWGDE_15645, partial [Streptomyces sp. NPDC054956]